MKLFLSSQAVSPEQSSAFLALFTQPPHQIKVAVIENAADVETDDSSWLTRNREALAQLGIQLDYVDLNDYLTKPETLAEVLQAQDGIWLGGGNTFYLRWILQKTGADHIITQLVHSGTVFGGGSAGAIVAGPTLRHIELADKPEKAPEVLEKGLGFTDTVVLPHWGDEKYGPVMVEIADRLRQDGYSSCPLTDAQALVIRNDEHTVVPFTVEQELLIR